MARRDTSVFIRVERRNRRALKAIKRRKKYRSIDEVLEAMMRQIA